MFGYVTWTVIVVCLTEVPAACKYVVNAMALSFVSSVLLYASYGIDSSRIRTRSDGNYVRIFDEALYRATSTVRQITKRWKIMILLIQKQWKMTRLIRKPVHRRIEELRTNMPVGRALSYRTPVSKVSISPLVLSSTGKISKTIRRTVETESWTECLRIPERTGLLPKRTCHLVEQ